MGSDVALVEQHQDGADLHEVRTRERAGHEIATLAGQLPRSAPAVRPQSAMTASTLAARRSSAGVMPA